MKDRMEETVARLKRQTLKRLLADDEAKLQTLSEAKSKKGLLNHRRRTPANGSDRCPGVLLFSI